MTKEIQEYLAAYPDVDAPMVLMAMELDARLKLERGEDYDVEELEFEPIEEEPLKFSDAPITEPYVEPCILPYREPGPVQLTIEEEQDSPEQGSPRSVLDHHE